MTKIKLYGILILDKTKETKMLNKKIMNTLSKNGITFVGSLAKEYKYICGVCGWRYILKPKNCHCGNDCEFEKIN